MLSHMEILTQIWDFWSPQSCEEWNMAKSRNFQSHWHFDSNLRIIRPPKRSVNNEIWPGSRTFWVALKFWLNLRILTTLFRWMMKVGQIEKSNFDSNLRFLTTLLVFVNNKIWGNQDNFESCWNFDLNLRFLITSGLANNESWSNQEILSHLEILTQIWDFLTTPVLRMIKCGQMKKFKVALKFWLNLRSWPSWCCEWWKLVISKTFESCWKSLTQIWDFWPPRSCERIKYGNQMKTF